MFGAKKAIKFNCFQDHATYVPDEVYVDDKERHKTLVHQSAGAELRKVERGAQRKKALPQDQHKNRRIKWETMEIG